MDLLQLEHFLAVVDEGTFTRAAERVCRSQPAVSHSIKKLEDELQSRLFVRDLPELSLTEAGKALVDHARRLVAARDDAVRELTALKHQQNRTLSIAAHESAAVYLLPSPLRLYFARFPNVRVGIHATPLTGIPRQVLDRDVHVGFVKEDPGFHELACIELHVDEMVLIASPRHRLAGRGVVEIGDLGDEPIVLHHCCRTTQQCILRAFEQHQTRCRVVAELWSFENIKTFVQNDVGIALVPRITVARELREHSLVRLRTPALDMPHRTLMIYRRQGYLSRAARELIELVRHFNWSAEAAA